MENLIKALQIFLKYGNPKNPTICRHDVLHVNIKPEIVSEKDKKKLAKLGFFVYKGHGEFYSFHFGSC